MRFEFQHLSLSILHHYLLYTFVINTAGVFPSPHIWIQSDYTFGGNSFAAANHTAYWLTDWRYSNAMSMKGEAALRETDHSYKEIEARDVLGNRSSNRKLALSEWKCNHTIGNCFCEDDRF